MRQVTQIKLTKTSEIASIKKEEGSLLATQPVCLTINELSFSYFGQMGSTLLDNISLKIYKNEFFTLLGPSGCGKTTLLRLIAGFQQQISGQILLGSQSLTEKPPFSTPSQYGFSKLRLVSTLDRCPERSLRSGNEKVLCRGN